MRVFIGYGLTELSQKTLEKWQSECDFLPKAKAVLPKNFHLTLLYNGELTTEQLEQYRLKLQVQKWQEIDWLTVTGITTFKKKNQAIIVANIENTPMLQTNYELVQEVARELGIPFAEMPKWQPHITLARQNGVAIEKNFLESVTLTTTKLIIFKSEKTFTGITYEVIVEL